MSNKPEKEYDNMLNVRIKKIRDELGISQEKFSDPLPISRSHYGGIESGLKKATPRVIDEICSKYGVNKDWLLNGEGDMFIDPLIDFKLEPNVEEFVRLFLEVDEETKEYVKGLMKKTLTK